MSADVKIRLSVEPSLKELVPGFLANRRRDLEALRLALHSGDLATVRDVGQNIRCFSRVLGFEQLTELGEEIRLAADECSTLRIAHLQAQLADYLERVEVSD
jgi:hypothetical protein